MNGAGGFALAGRAALVVAAACTLAACSGKSSAAQCVKVSTDCAPLYPPTFDQMFTNTLHKTCGSAATGSSCHAASGMMGGLVFANESQAYQLLLETSPTFGVKRVIPGNPSCSLVVEKLESSDPKFQMPPGAPLSAEERCSIEQWIANGAAPPADAAQPPGGTAVDAAAADAAQPPPDAPPGDATTTADGAPLDAGP